MPDTIPGQIALFGGVFLAGCVAMKIACSFVAAYNKQSEKDDETRCWAERGNRAMDQLYELRGKVAELERMPHNQWKPNK